MEQEGNLMSDYELFYEIEDSKYGDGVVLNKYGDRYSIVAARKGKDEGTVWKEWAFPQDRDKQPRAKAIPLGVRIGNFTETVKFAKWLLSNLQPAGGQDEPPPF
jgi:hypothetical protein